MTLFDDHDADTSTFCAHGRKPLERCPWCAAEEPAVKLHADAHDTERAAARSALPRSGTARRRVLDRLVALGDTGATDDELQAHLKMPPNTQRPRRVELVDLGLVVDSGRRRASAYGNDAIVWIRSTSVDPR